MPVPISRTPSSMPASARSRSSVRSSGSAVPRREPGDGDVAALVVQRGEQPDKRGQRVRHRPAVDPVVHGVVQRPHLDHRVDAAAQRGGQRRHADPPVGRVGEHDDVGGEPVAVLGEEPASVGEPISSSPSMSTVTPTPRSSPSARSAAQVQRDAGLVVGRAPAEQPAVALRPARTGRCPSPPRSPGGCTS